MTHNEVMEREADYFARCLLMPAAFVIKDLLLMGGMDVADDKQMAALAKRYQVSIAMMTLRVLELWPEYQRAASRAVSTSA